MISVDYRYAVYVYIFLQLLLVAVYVLTDDFTPMGFWLSSLGLTFTLLGYYFSSQERKDS